MGLESCSGMVRLVAITVCGAALLVLLLFVAVTSVRILHGQAVSHSAILTRMIVIAVIVAFASWVLRPSNSWPN